MATITSDWELNFLLLEDTRVFKRGFLFYGKPDQHVIKCFDRADHNTLDREKVSQFLCTVRPDLVVPLRAVVDFGLRTRVLLSKQLEKTSLEAGNAVLVVDGPQENPEERDVQQESDLKRQTIAELLHGHVITNEELTRSADRVFDADYLERTDLEWTENLLDGGVGRATSLSRDELVLYREGGRRSLGRLKWLGRVPWEERRLMGIELLKETDEARGEEDGCCVNYRRVMDADEKRSKIVTEDKIVAGVSIVMVTTDCRTGSGKTTAGGSLWCRAKSQLLCLDEEGELSCDKVRDRVVEVPAKLLGVIEEVERASRKRLVLSGQLEETRLEAGEDVLVWKSGQPAVPESLRKEKIVDVKDGRIVTESSLAVTADRIFDLTYPQRQGHPWTANLLDVPPDGSPRFLKDELVSFIQDDRCHVGHLKWMGAVPWTDQRLMGIECLTAVPEEAEAEGQDRRLVHFVPVMEMARERASVVQEPEVEAVSSIYFLWNHIPATDEAAGQRRGTLWCRHGQRLWSIEGRASLERRAAAEYMQEAPLHLLRLLLHTAGLEERSRALLTEQLEGLRLVDGEEVFVVKDPARRGNPMDDLEKTRIRQVRDGLPSVDEFGVLTAERILTKSYFTLGHSWAENRLGRPGYQQLAVDQDVEFEVSGHRGRGKVKLFGDVPWLDDLLIGIEAEEEVEAEGGDRRFVEFLQLLHCDASKACVVPLASVQGSFGEAYHTAYAAEPNDDLPLGTRVVIVYRGKCWRGAVKWTGRHRATHNSPMAVVVMNKKHPEGTNGQFLGETLITCDEGKALLVNVDRLHKTEALEVGDCVRLILEPDVEGHVRWIGDDVRQVGTPVGIELVKRHENYNDVSEQFYCRRGFGLYRMAHELSKLAVVTGDVSEPEDPISSAELASVCGLNKGIQGQNNSCYLDTLLFSMFTFTAAFEDRVTRGKRKDDSPRFKDAQKVLLHGVVYPLRKHKFVPDDKVAELRQLLAEESGKKEFLTDTRDIPECMDVLFGSLLKMEPMVEIGDGSFYSRCFTVETLPIENDEVRVRTSQLYLEHAVMTMSFHLKEKPDTLILQLPRQRRDRPILNVPSLVLDLKHCLRDSGPKQCAFCQHDAGFMNPTLFDQQGLVSTFLCGDCARHSKSSCKIPGALCGGRVREGHDTRLFLSAVLCAELSHYNCFVRCGDKENDPWIFFDSMADQTKSGKNIPQVQEIDLPGWIRIVLSEKKYNPETFGDHRAMSERAFVYPYSLIYRTVSA